MTVVRRNVDTEEDLRSESAAAVAPNPSGVVRDEAASGRRAILSGARTRLLGQLISFGLIGGIAFLVDVTVYNVLRATVLQDAPIWSKVVSVAAATVVAWLGNRHLTFRRERSPHALREGATFAVVNVMGLLIAAGCLYVSHYVLGFTSTLADNVSGNVVGLVLGTIFRFAAYRWFVFTPRSRTLDLALPTRPLVRTDIGGLS